MKKTNKILVILVIIVVAAILIFINNKDEVKENIIKQEVVDINITISIQDFTKPNLELKINEQTSVLNVLENINTTNPDLNLKYKSYNELGVLVEQLGNSTNGTDNRYWQYYINKKQPMVSVDKYILQNYPNFQVADSKLSGY